jgi:hypothetical protein
MLNKKELNFTCRFDASTEAAGPKAPLFLKTKKYIFDVGMTGSRRQFL